jgi:hypothetical protein
MRKTLAAKAGLGLRDPAEAVERGGAVGEASMRLPLPSKIE